MIGIATTTARPMRTRPPHAPLSIARPPSYPPACRPPRRPETPARRTAGPRLGRLPRPTSRAARGWSRRSRAVRSARSARRAPSRCLRSSACAQPHLHRRYHTGPHEGHVVNQQAHGRRGHQAHRRPSAKNIAVRRRRVVVVHDVAIEGVRHLGPQLGLAIEEVLDQLCLSKPLEFLVVYHNHAARLFVRLEPVAVHGVDL
eukprot:945679-Prymnesium_polylepis.1